MNEAPENIKKETAAEKISDKMCALPDYAIKGDYDVTLQLMPKSNGGTPACTHSMKGHMNHNLLGVLAVCGTVGLGLALGVTLVHACCSLMCRAK